MKQPHKLATEPVSTIQPQGQTSLPAAPKPVFVPPQLSKQGSLAALTQDFGGSFDPGPLDP